VRESKRTSHGQGEGCTGKTTEKKGGGGGGIKSNGTNHQGGKPAHLPTTSRGIKVGQGKSTLREGAKGKKKKKKKKQKEEEEKKKNSRRNKEKRAGWELSRYTATEG